MRRKLVSRLAPRVCAGVLLVALAGGVLVAGCDHHQPAANTVRVGVLKFGTANWEMAVLQSHHLAKKQGLHLELVPLASKNALGVALRGGRVDMIVSDWLWVARQDAEGADYQFFPYSLAVGAVMVNPHAGIKTVADLAGKRIGVAGGELDKTWLLLRAYAQKSTGMKLAEKVHPVYAAPPILGKLLSRGSLPAVINYWQYNARARAAGMTRLVSVDTMLAKLGVSPVPPLLGWVFSAKWARQHDKLLKAFLASDYRAKDVLRRSEQAWAAIDKLVKPGNARALAMIQHRYRAGIPTHYGQPEIKAAGQLFQILAREGGRELTGGAKQLPEHLFWRGSSLP